MLDDINSALTFTITSFHFLCVFIFIFRFRRLIFIVLRKCSEAKTIEKGESEQKIEHERKNYEKLTKMNSTAGMMKMRVELTACERILVHQP